MATVCPRCGGTLERVHRSPVARALYRRVQRCTRCGSIFRSWRVPFEAGLTFVFSRYSRCIQCSSYRVRRLPSRDRIDSLSAHPLSVMLALTRAPFYHCNPCRLQYHDWRAVRPSDDPAEQRADASA